MTCKYAAEGFSNPEIAQRMGVTVHAVDRHFHNMYKKLEVNREGNGENRPSTSYPPHHPLRPPM
ncbi:MAG: helix-turn-helix transcriptional regulator [Chloroflexi bacterium]|nr:helix-turn-helix transcriptional regulator [Chloroflexota bacterium]